MALADITRSAILDAIAQCETYTQPEKFLADHGFGAATKYRLAHNGKLYDSKAIVGVAHHHATGVALKASDFSGGDPVIRVLERTGFEIVVIAEQENSDAATALLGHLHDLRTHTNRDGKPAFYQHITLLWAISRARANAARMTRYEAASPELGRYLRLFQLDKSAPSPANPWVALRASPWWDLEVPDDQPVSHKDANRLNLSAGLATNVRDRIVSDEAFAIRAVALLAQIIGDHRALPSLLHQLNLDNLRDSEPAPHPRVPTVIRIPLEASHTERFSTSAPEPTIRERKRREAQLQRAYTQHLDEIGHKVARHRIAFPDGSQLYTDIHNETVDELIEVKATTDRPTIRLALGQILDYRRYLCPRASALLVPTEPADDLIKLFHSHGIRVIWQTLDGQFAASREAER